MSHYTNCGYWSSSFTSLIKVAKSVSLKPNLFIPVSNLIHMLIGFVGSYFLIYLFDHDYEQLGEYYFVSNIYILQY